MKSFDIKKLLDEKITEGSLIRTGETPEAIINFNKIAAQVEKLQGEILRRLKNKLTGVPQFDGLSSAIHELELQEGWAGEVFARVASDIRLEFGNESRFLDELNRVGTDYFKSNLKSEFKINAYDEIKSDNLPEILQKIKNTIKGMDSHEIKEFDVDNLRFKFAALKEVQTELENQFSERQMLKKQKKKIETDRLNEENENSKYFVQRNEKQVFLALEVIMRLLGSSGNYTDKGKFMSFLSGYSAEAMRQFYSKSENWKDKRQSLEYVYDICVQSGLLRVVKEVKKEIEILDKKI